VESGNLCGFDALWQIRRLGSIADSGAGVVVAAAEEAGEEASEAKGSYFKEVAPSARGGQKGHELSSKVLHGEARIEASVPGGIRGDNDTFGGPFPGLIRCVWTAICCSRLLIIRELYSPFGI
jgi:hypothetical protein